MQPFLSIYPRRHTARGSRAVNLHRSAVVILVVALTLLLAACGGDDDDEGGGGTQQQAPAETTGGGGGQTVSEVALSEYKFEPAAVTAKAGSTITVKNEGSLGHDLKLRMSGKEVGGTPVFGAGKSERLRITFASGQYEMFCSVPGHEQQGMKGTFTVG
jgi:plastocyanin